MEVIDSPVVRRKAEESQRHVKPRKRVEQYSRTMGTIAGSREGAKTESSDLTLLLKIEVPTEIPTIRPMKPNQLSVPIAFAMKRGSVLNST
jgi:hypothetical protein